MTTAAGHQQGEEEVGRRGGRHSGVDERLSEREVALGGRRCWGGRRGEGGERNRAEAARSGGRELLWGCHGGEVKVLAAGRFGARASRSFCLWRRNEEERGRDKGEFERSGFGRARVIG